MIDWPLALRFFGAVAVISLGLYGFVLYGKHGGFTAGAMLGRCRLVEVIETTPLPRAGSLHVVKVADEYFVIGRTDGAIAMLREIPKESGESVLSARTSPRFSRMPDLRVRARGISE
ncbi:MAG: flagellar biosynthetic protein FliO [Candidatus Eremiobacteraeota bacterium]|nr:flagellar biosynthetic protein FliO [Candidatus Eremiobacteraeota bacterium]